MRTQSLSLSLHVRRIALTQHARRCHSWSENLACNTVHIDDFASALVASAAWARSLGSREAILAANSVNLPPTFDSNKPFEALASGPAPVVAAKKEEKEIRACVFNVEDGGSTNQKTVADLIADAVGVRTGFHGTIVSTFAKLNLGDVVEDANEKVSDRNFPGSFCDIGLPMLSI